MLRFFATIVLLVVISLPVIAAMNHFDCSVAQILFWGALVISLWTGGTAWISTFSSGGFCDQNWNDLVQKATIYPKVAFPFMLLAAALIAYLMNL